MSSALAIAGVSAVLQFYLTNLYTPVSALFGGTVTVSAKAPDLVQEAFTPGSPENQVNLFLHQVTHNAGWRNQDLPSDRPRRQDAAVQPAARARSALPVDRVRLRGLAGRGAAGLRTADAARESGADAQRHQHRDR